MEKKKRLNFSYTEKNDEMIEMMEAKLKERNISRNHYLVDLFSREKEKWNKTVIVVSENEVKNFISEDKSKSRLRVCSSNKIYYSYFKTDKKYKLLNKENLFGNINSELRGEDIFDEINDCSEEDYNFFFHSINRAWDILVVLADQVYKEKIGESGILAIERFDKKIAFKDWKSANNNTKGNSRKSPERKAAMKRSISVNLSQELEEWINVQTIEKKLKKNEFILNLMEKNLYDYEKKASLNIDFITIDSILNNFRFDDPFWLEEHKNFYCLNINKVMDTLKDSSIHKLKLNEAVVKVKQYMINIFYFNLFSFNLNHIPFKEEALQSDIDVFSDYLKFLMAKNPKAKIICSEDFFEKLEEKKNEEITFKKITMIKKESPGSVDVIKKLEGSDLDKALGNFIDKKRFKIKRWNRNSDENNEDFK